ncbi:hypothetical protein LCGC14_0224360 [marine sediment metagenome]|uniref:Uncharacterized protein n=1 Tax=marine sediment metagenome TaxID=412755 RepID=A0A0F9XG49_9ZZZZ
MTEADKYTPPVMTKEYDVWRKEREAKRETIHILEDFPRLPCKWIRPLRDVFVACWNEEKVNSILGDKSGGVGTLRILDRTYCRGEVDDMPDCWKGLEERCIDRCKHYVKMKNDKYSKLKGFCTKQCHDFKKYENKHKTGRAKVIEF